MPQFKRLYAYSLKDYAYSLKDYAYSLALALLINLNQEN